MQLHHRVPSFEKLKVDTERENGCDSPQLILSFLFLRIKKKFSLKLGLNSLKETEVHEKEHKNRPDCIISMDLHDVINHISFLAAEVKYHSVQETLLKLLCYCHSYVQ